MKNLYKSKSDAQFDRQVLMRYRNNVGKIKMINNFTDKKRRILNRTVETLLKTVDANSMYKEDMSKLI